MRLLWLGLAAAGALLPATALAQEDHAGHGEPPAEAAVTVAPQTGAELPIGEAEAPPPPTDNAADAIFGSDAMRSSQEALRREHGGARIAKVMIDEVERRLGEDHDGFGWAVQLRYGGDINRFVLKTEGEIEDGEGVEAAEVQALYSRAVGPYTDLQFGLRYDFEPVSRTSLVVGFDTLLPYWIEVEGAAFLSNRGELTARFEAEYDLRITQKLILQPAVEIQLAAEDIPERGMEAGLSSVEVGLRLRYEVRKTFAPYIGVTYERAFARPEGEASLVVGLRAWF